MAMHQKLGKSRPVLVDQRHRPRYTIAEVARYLGLNPSTVRSWFYARKYRAAGGSRLSEPVLKPADHNPRGPSLSFFNLVEAHVLSATRRDFKVSMTAVRSAAESVREQTGSIHPLITKKFSTDGKDLFIRVLEQSGEVLVNASRKGQRGFPEILNDYLQRIRWDAEGLPLRIYPMPEGAEIDRSVVVSSLLGSGRPVLAKVGVLLETIWNRHSAGEAVDELADDYDVTAGEIERAIAYYQPAQDA